MEGASPSSADRFGPYVLVREIGRGGQGTVWLADDTRLGRKVALKLLHPGAGSVSDREIARFRREAESASKLDHPNICALLDAGDVDGTPFLAFRHVEGETLVAWIERAACARRGEAEDGMAPDTDPHSKEGIGFIVLIFEKLARALHKAHEAGLIHRDIKPGNIMVSEDGDEPVILDFGLAREELGDGVSLTHSGDLLGTPAYMSPEQLMAQRIPLDRRTDIYSLGATLYECLTLQRPFAALTRAELYHKILHDTPSSTGSLNRLIPRDLQVVVETAIEKDRNRRYQSALDLAEDLRRIREFEPIRARPIGRWLRAKRWAQRHPAAAAGFSGILLVLVVAIVLLIRVRSERDIARAQALTATSVQLLPEDPYVAMLLALEAVNIDRSPDAISAVHQALAEVRERQMITHHTLVYDAAFSPQRDRVVTAGEDGFARIFIIGSDTEPIKLDHLGKPVKAATFSPAGDRVLTACEDGNARIWTIGSGSPTVLSGHERALHDASWSANEKWIVTASDDGTARLWTSEGAEARALEHGARVLCARFSHDSTRIMTGCSDGVVRIWSVDGSPISYTNVPIARHFRDVLCASFSLDGTEVISSGLGENNARRWTTNEPREVIQSYEHGSSVFWIDVDRRNGRVLTASADQTARVTDRNGRVIADFRGHESRLTRARFSSDYEQVVTSSEDGTVRIWDVDPVLPDWVADDAGVQAVAMSPNGKLIATAGRAGSVSVWTLRGERVWTTPRDVADRIRKSNDVEFCAGDLVSAGVDNVVRLWRVSDGKQLRSWRVADGSGLQSWRAATDALESVVPIAGASNLVAAVGNGSVWSIDLSGRDQPRKIVDAWSGAVGSAPDRPELAVTTRQHKVRLVRLDPMGEDVFGGHPSWVARIHYSPDGRWIACASGTDVFLHARDGTVSLPSLSHHSGNVTCARFSSNSAHLLTTSRDKTACLWNVSGERDLITVLRGHTELVWDAVFTRDDSRVYTASFDGTVRSWFVDQEEMLREAEGRVFRDFTVREQKRFKSLIDPR